MNNNIKNNEVANNPYNEEYYDSIAKEMLNFFHKNVITVSTGTILLSITFIDKIIPFPNKNTLDILLWSWIFFISSIISSLFFHLSIYYIVVHHQNYLQKKRTLENLKNDEEIEKIKEHYIAVHQQNYLQNQRTLENLENDDEIKKIKEEISKFEKSKFKTILYRIEEITNVTSIIFMILGIIFLVSFSYKNILYKAHKTTKTEYDQ